MLDAKIIPPRGKTVMLPRRSPQEDCDPVSLVVASAARARF